MHGAVAVDLGATSGRFAAGKLVNGRIEFEVIEQIPHNAIEHNGRLEWQLDLLLGLCKRAVAYAEAHFDSATLGIDSWGVDHGFLNADGSLHSQPVCYRDLSHAQASERLRPHRPGIYSLTGIQHQPFNTLNQLAARKAEDPAIAQCRWLVLPDLLGYLLSGEIFHELTEASTTQLMGLDCRWAEAAFDLIGWPVPDQQPKLPGVLGAKISDKVTLAHVGSHDTASAVAGFGDLQDDQVFLNVGTWSLIGTVIDEPIANPSAEAANFTNERCVDGRVRFLRNVPGFYVINRLHDELGVTESVPAWLGKAQQETTDVVDLFDEEFFNPASMVDACVKKVKQVPTTQEGWAELALRSLVAAVASQPAELASITGRTFKSIRVGGGGSQSSAFCQALANATGLVVLAGPAEATVLGNLAAQFLASGLFASWKDAWKSVANSTKIHTYKP